MDGRSQLPPELTGLWPDLQQHVRVLFRKEGGVIDYFEGSRVRIRVNPEPCLIFGEYEILLKAVGVIIVKDRSGRVTARWFRIYGRRGGKAGELRRFLPSGKELPVEQRVQWVC